MGKIKYCGGTTNMTGNLEACHKEEAKGLLKEEGTKQSRKKYRSGVFSILMPPTCNIAHLNRHTPKISGEGLEAVLSGYPNPTRYPVFLLIPDLIQF